MPVETPIEETGTHATAARVAPARSHPAARPGTARRVERTRDRAGVVRPGGRRQGPQLPEVRQRVRTGARVPVVAAPPAVIVRRRVAAVTLGLVLAVLVGVAVALLPGDTPAAGEPSAATRVTVVGSGESLTEVARRASPGADPAATLERIRELNGLSSSAVAAGRPLVVPAG